MTIDIAKLRAEAQRLIEITSSDPRTGALYRHEYLKVATPETLLALVADNESAHKHWQNESNNAQALIAETARLTGERDQLKAENEALQRNFEILLEAANNMLSFAHPTCMNDEKWRDRVAGFAAGDRYD